MPFVSGDLGFVFGFYYFLMSDPQFGLGKLDYRKEEAPVIILDSPKLVEKNGPWSRDWHAVRVLAPCGVCWVEDIKIRPAF